MGRRGYPKVITGTDPAANTEISETVTAGKHWELLAVQLTLVTDANAANRRVHLTLDDGTTEFYRMTAPVAHTASLTWKYNFAENASLDASAALNVQVPMPRLIVGPGFRIKTVTTNRQAGDNFGAPILYVVEYDGVPTF